MMSHHSVVTGGDQGSAVLAQVHEGMAVFNNARKRIGTVEAVFLGTASEEERELGTGPATADDPRTPGSTLGRTFAEIFDPTDIPDTVANRLRYSGFIRVDSPGLFAADRFVTPEEIASVTSEGVFLRTDKADRIEDR
jgi:hypothetical protein